MRKKLALKTAAFGLLLAVLLAGASKLVTAPADYRNYQWIAGFYEEPRDTLDAVYIGGSNTYAFWAAPLAWEHYGIAIYPYACNSQPLMAARYLIEDARKTQPDALYIISINGFDAEPTQQRIHYLADYMPLSVNKLKMIQHLSEQGDFTWPENLEFYFPLLRYHSRWSELSEDDFHYTSDGLKGGSSYSGYLKKVSDVSGSFRSTTRRQELTDDVQAELEALLAYCDTEQVNVLFVTAPQARTDESYLAQINTINDLAQSHGYPVVNMMECVEEIGLDLTKDYYNANHTNVHGAIKTTDYLAKYLVENYGFQDKRESAAYNDWDTSYDKYVDVIAPYALDIEYTNAARSGSLAAPNLSNVSVNGTVLTVKWKASSGADGYQIYRKTADSSWSPLGQVGADTLFYEDEDCRAGEAYTYTVIAYQESGDAISWGKYDFEGVSAAATLDAPRFKTLSEGETGPVLTWEGVRGADGYTVYRRVVGKSWVKLEDVGLETAYIDSNTLVNMPYEYRVRAYYMEDEELKWGSYSSRQLWLPELFGPQIAAEVKDGKVVLTWPVVEGITGYTVARKTADSDWVQLAEPLEASCRRFEDLTVQPGILYLYQVTAYLKYGDDTYEFSTETTDWMTSDIPGLSLAAPKILFAEPVGDRIQLVWEPQEYASAYRIYRQKDGAETWTVVKKSTTDNTYLDKSLKPGVYTYVIQALHGENGCTYYGEFQIDADYAGISFKLSDKVG